MFFAPEGLEDVGSQVWVTLLSHYLGYTLSQHLGDSFRFATPGKVFCDIVAPLRVFFWRFARFPCQSVIASSAIVFFASNNQSVFHPQICYLFSDAPQAKSNPGVSPKY
jgi:hypothetical protein